MGDVLRRYLSVIGRSVKKAALPALLVGYGLALCFYISGQELDLSTLAALVALSHLMFSLCGFLYEMTMRNFRIERLDLEIIGRTFSGMRRIDRMFCNALTMLSEENPVEALDLLLELEKAELTEQERMLVLFYTARCYQLTGYTANSIQRYHAAQALGMQNDYLFLFLGRSLTEGGEYEEAEACYQTLLQRETRSFFCVRTDLGMLFLRQRKGSMALRWFTESMNRHENYAFALGGCALSYLLLGDPEQSRTYYEKAILNQIPDLEGFQAYYQEVSEAVQQSEPEPERAGQQE